jgi:hypothetical protein
MSLAAETLPRSLREAILTLLAVLATLASTQCVAPGPASAVLGVVLSLSLSRSHLAGDRRGRRDALLALPIVSLACVGVGALLRHAPWAGAAVFVAGMALSVWMRRFGPAALRAGSLIALPLVTILVVPHLARHGEGALSAILVPVAVALAALAWVELVQALGRRIGWMAAPTAVDAASAGPRAASAMRPSPSTRMALQMGAALAASFVVGYLFFPSHWSWIVLTAFIVNSGNRGRQDVVYKSALRVLGAAAGTLLAMAVSSQAAVHGATAATLILACVFLGVWLRPLGYGWWALFVTLALALLQALQAPEPQSLAFVWQRLMEIAIGALLGLGAAWFVYPIRSTDVLRRRLADALAAMGEAMDPQTDTRRGDAIVAAIAQVEQLRPSFHARHLALRRWQAVQPVDWINTLTACRAPAIALVERGEAPGVVRKAIGSARKAMREPAEILPALMALRQALDRSESV